MLTDDRGKILVLLENGTEDLKGALLEVGGELLCSGGAASVLQRFLEAASGPLAPLLRWELWKLPPEGPAALLGEEGEPGAIFRVPARSGAFATLGLVIVYPKEHESSLSLSSLDLRVLDELARQGGSARMGVLSLKLETPAHTLKRRIMYLERLGYVRREGERRKALYVLQRKRRGEE